jgi:hypothetical protein
MENVLRAVDRGLPYEIEASGRLEANLMEAGRDLLLNLVNYSFGHQGGPQAIAAVERVEPLVEVACAVRSRRPRQVVIEPSGAELAYQFEEGICRFTVPRVEHLAVVRLCGGGG